MTTEEIAYARSIGIKPRRLRTLGGAAKLKALSPEARGVLLGSHFPGNSLTVARGGLAARGMRKGRTDYIIKPRIIDTVGKALDILFAEEDLQALSTESLGG